MVVRNGALADHVHGGGREAATAGVEVEGARRRLDLLDESAVAVGTDHRVLPPYPHKPTAPVAPIRGCPRRHLDPTKIATKKPKLNPNREFQFAARSSCSPRKKKSPKSKRCSFPLSFFFRLLREGEWVWVRWAKVQDKIVVAR